MNDDPAAAIKTIAAIDIVPSLLAVVCRMTGMGLAAIARVTEDRWIACAVRDGLDFGLRPGSELPIDTTVCQRIRQSGQPVVFAHASADPQYAVDPIPRLYGIESYISFPIRLPSGAFFGTLCALDSRPVPAIEEEFRGLFALLAELLAFHIDAQQQLDRSDAELRREQATALLREEFLAVLSHDLKNPLASLGAGLRLLRRAGLPEGAEEVAGLMDTSLARMARLIDDTTDLTRARLGGGLELEDAALADLAPVIRQAVDELALSHPGHRITVAIAPAHARISPPRLGQLVSNLVGNALTHGAAESPVRVEGRAEGEAYRLDVVNGGAPIDPAMMSDIFKPFVHARRGREGGLGLGLFIAAEIARAHGGRLEAASDAAETRFTLWLPLRAG